MQDAFHVADDILLRGVQGISYIITIPGLINVDFADVKAIMHQSGSAIMGIGRGTGEGRALEAARMAVNSPLLETTIDGAFHIDRGYPNFAEDLRALGANVTRE